MTADHNSPAFQTSCLGGATLSRTELAFEISLHILQTPPARCTNHCGISPDMGRHDDLSVSHLSPVYYYRQSHIECQLNDGMPMGDGGGLWTAPSLSLNIPSCDRKSKDRRRRKRRLWRQVEAGGMEWDWGRQWPITTYSTTWPWPHQCQQQSFSPEQMPIHAWLPKSQKRINTYSCLIAAREAAEPSSIRSHMKHQRQL